MALSLNKLKRLGDAGLTELFEQDQKLWTAMAKDAYGYTRKFIGAEVRPNSMVAKVEYDAAKNRVTGVLHYRGESQELHRQRARCVVIAGYSIETPRLLLNSECASFPNAAHDDQVDALSQALIRVAGTSSGFRQRSPGKTQLGGLRAKAL